MNDQEPRRWPGYTEDAYPEVFNTMTAQPKTLKPGQISEEKARQFFDEVLCHLCTQGFIQDFILRGGVQARTGGVTHGYTRDLLIYLLTYLKAVYI